MIKRDFCPFFQRVKGPIFIFDTLSRLIKNVSEFVKPVSSAYIGTVESGLADSRKIQIKIRIICGFFPY